ncbi:MAG: cation diffusion facilitator family transporter, partial [Synechococcaceae bacterium WBB_10_009]|nr:cation diffusion facilitator family transporter [Synechococcaceae bacterium WBB_10_009]
MSAPQEHPHDHSHGHPAAQEALAIQRQPHPHQHEHRAGSPGAFRWSVILNSGLSGLQLVIGFGFGSLALVSDAIHNLGDVAGLLLGWGAERLSTRPASGRFTYGFGRSTQLASLVNAVLILMASAVLVVEGLQRLGRGGHSIDSLPVHGSMDAHGFRDLEMEAEVLELTRGFGIGAQFGGKY